MSKSEYLRVPYLDIISAARGYTQIDYKGSGYLRVPHLDIIYIRCTGVHQIDHKVDKLDT